MQFVTIIPQPDSTMSGNNSTTMEMEMKSLYEKKIEYPQIPQMRPVGVFENMYQLIMAYASYYQHITGAVLVTLLILGVILVLNLIAVISTKTPVAFSSITHDYTDVKYYSKFDLLLKDVDHWCLLGGNDDCTCDDPTMPLPGYNHHNWTKAWKKNREIARKDHGHVDVVFLGDQAIEAWNGRLSGIQLKSLKQVSKVFNDKFNNKNETDLQGIALGIAGDTIANLYWRLMHGEMPEQLDPSVWWITIGGNDLAFGQCSEEVVILGILRIAELILDRRPSATIVINSLLPSRTQLKTMKKRRIKLDLWSSIQAINDQLKKFCEKNNVKYKFFDSTEIFFTEKLKSVDELKEEMKKKGKKSLTNKDTPSMKIELITNDGKLTPRGHIAWLNVLNSELQRILTDELYIRWYEEGIMNDIDDLFDDSFTFTDDAQP